MIKAPLLFSIAYDNHSIVKPVRSSRQERLYTEVSEIVKTVRSTILAGFLRRTALKLARKARELHT